MGIRLRENETVQLMKESGNGRVDQLSFGPGWIALADVPANEWARLRVQEMRSQAQTPVSA